MPKFFKIFVAIILLAVINFLPIIPATSAQTSTDLPPFAAVTDGNLYLYNFGDEPIQVTDYENALFHSIAFAPDGETVLYSVTSIGEPHDISGIWMTDIHGGIPVRLGTASEYSTYGFPLTFTEDGQLLTVSYDRETRLATIENPQLPPDSDFFAPYAIYKMPLESETTPEAVALMPFAVGCGGISSPLLDAYGAETGPNTHPFILEKVEAGYLVTLTCNGNGVGLTSGLDGSWELIGWLTNPALSPDGTRIAGIDVTERIMSNFSIDSLSPLVVVEINTKSSTELRVPPRPEDLTTFEQIHWSDDGNIYYTMRTQTGIADLTEEVGQLVVQRSPYFTDGVPLYEVYVMQLDPETGIESLVYNVSASAIARFDDKDGFLYFSVVPNATQWLTAFEEGEIDFSQPYYILEDRQHFPISIVRLESDGESVTYDDSLKRFTLYPQP